VEPGREILQSQTALNGKRKLSNPFEANDEENNLDLSSEGWKSADNSSETVVTSLRLEWLRVTSL
jgi:hypothetical protein